MEKKFDNYFKPIKHKIPYWNELPEIDLYMDQVIALMDKYLYFHKSDEEQNIVTHSMINNYVKHEIMPAPIKKKYSREHLAYLIIICILKPVLPLQEISNIINVKLKSSSIEETLDFFSDLYDSIFNTVLAIGNKYSKKLVAENNLSDTALYMAIGSAASQYISMEISVMNKDNKEDIEDKESKKKKDNKNKKD